jgi:transcriptional regulator with XRE-family HTH domain
MTVQTSGGLIPEFVVGDRLRKARELTGLTQLQFADEVGVTRNTISAWEASDTLPRPILLKAWAMRTGVSYDWLATGIDTGPTAPGGGLLNSDRYSGFRGVSVLAPRTYQTLVAA